MVLDSNAVRSVDRAAALLIALGDSPGEAGVTELARRLGLHKSTASRLLGTLQKRGLVEQDGETGKYRLGLAVIRLARIRRRGYATAVGEYESSLNAVAAPIHDARGKVITAVDVWGPAFRLTPRRFPELGAQVRETAAAITVRLGGNAPEPEPSPVPATA